MSTELVINVFNCIGPGESDTPHSDSVYEPELENGTMDAENFSDWMDRESELQLMDDES